MRTNKLVLWKLFRCYSRYWVYWLWEWLKIGRRCMWVMLVWNLQFVSQFRKLYNLWSKRRMRWELLDICKIRILESKSSKWENLPMPLRTVLPRRVWWKRDDRVRNWIPRNFVSWVSKRRRLLLKWEQWVYEMLKWGSEHIKSCWIIVCKHVLDWNLSVFRLLKERKRKRRKRFYSSLNHHKLLLSAFDMLKL